MNTPIYDFIKKYGCGNTLRLHMPGHKGTFLNALPQELFSLDITEIKGADSLFEAEGIIAESERNMSRLYESCATAYSTAGSTLCIQAMLTLMKREGRKIFAVRNVHRAFLNACALLDLDVEWLMPHYSGGLLSGELSLALAEERLSKCEEPCCIYVTSPDYTGKLADIKALSQICHKYGARLLVDNAHGAHLAFFSESLHPIALGADLCCDSAHKMLPALTGAAMLHSSCEEYAKELKPAMGLFGSTSPSYLVMASLDLCTDYIDRRIRDDICENTAHLARLRESFGDMLVFAESEPFHITVNAAQSGLDGNELAEKLRDMGAECEYADGDIVILLMSPVNSEEDFIRLEHALRDAAAKCGRSASRVCEEFSLPEPVKAMSIREAVFAPSEDIPVEDAEGRVCAAVKVPCPPAVPVAVSGEIITRRHIEVFRRYGIRTVNIVTDATCCPTTGNIANSHLSTR